MNLSKILSVILITLSFSGFLEAAESPAYDCLLGRVSTGDVEEVEFFTIDSENPEFLNSYEVEVNFLLGCKLSDTDFSCTIADHFSADKYHNNLTVPFGVNFSGITFKIDDSLSYHLTCDERK